MQGDTWMRGWSKTTREQLGPPAWVQEYGASIDVWTLPWGGEESLQLALQLTWMLQRESWWQARHTAKQHTPSSKPDSPPLNASSACSRMPRKRGALKDGRPPRKKNAVAHEERVQP